MLKLWYASCFCGAFIANGLGSTLEIFSHHHPMGILLCVCVGLIGMYAASISPLDAVTLAILIGAVIGNIVPVPPQWKTGIVWSEKNLLGIAIALYGLKLDFNTLKDLGLSSMLMVLLTIILTLLLANPISKLFKVDSIMGLTICDWHRHLWVCGHRCDQRHHQSR